MREKVVIFFGVILLFTAVLGVITTYGNISAADNSTASEKNHTNEFFVQGKVLEIEEPHNSLQLKQEKRFIEQKVTLRILNGKYKGKIYKTINPLSHNPGMDLNISPDDKVVVYLSEENGCIKKVYISDMVRSDYMNYILFAFISLLVLVGGIKGIKALVALGFTILAVFKLLLPALLQGYPPLPLTTVVLVIVTVFTMIVVAGFSSKSLAATLGTIGGVVIAGYLAYRAGDLAHLYGLATEESQMLLYVPNLKLDMRGLLFSGIIIGALGAIMDVAMSVASAMDEVRKANPRLSRCKLILSGINVGRDIMGTMANTLILAYTGGALPFLLLYMAYNTAVMRIINSELIAGEVVRALAGSIGLILSVPITAFIAGIFMGNRN